MSKTNAANLKNFDHKRQGALKIVSSGCSDELKYQKCTEKFIARIKQGN